MGRLRHCHFLVYYSSACCQPGLDHSIARNLVQVSLSPGPPQLTEPSPVAFRCEKTTIKTQLPNPIVRSPVDTYNCQCVLWEALLIYANFFVLSSKLKDIRNVWYWQTDLSINLFGTLDLFMIQWAFNITKLIIFSSHQFNFSNATFSFFILTS